MTLKYFFKFNLMIFDFQKIKLNIEKISLQKKT
jgi:hypothetical protein